MEFVPAFEGETDLRPRDSFKKTDIEQSLCQIDQVIIDYLHWNYVIVFYLAECEA